MDSVSGVVETFFRGSTSALFRDRIHFNVFVLGVILLVAEWLILGTTLTLRADYGLLLMASIVVWGLAHLLHPLIYQPFKYTRLVFMVSVLVPVGENLLPAARRLRSLVTSWKTFYGLIVMAFAGAGIYVALLPGVFYGRTAGFGSSISTVVTVLLLLPLVGLILSTGFANPNWSRGGSIILVAGLVVLPLLPHDFEPFEWRGVKARNLSGVYDILKETPPGTIVAAPPYFYSEIIPAFGRRGVYASRNLSTFPLACERLRHFWENYFSSSAFGISYFLEMNEIDYLLVDRQHLRYRNPAMVKRCGHSDMLRSIRNQKNLYLDQHFENASWKWNRRLYLLSQDEIVDG
jgi:hypothetical protein